MHWECRTSKDGVVVTFPLAILITVLGTAALTAAVALLLRRFLPRGALRWTKLAARYGMVATTVVTTLRLLTCFIPGGVVQVELRFPTFWPHLPSAVNYLSTQGKIQVVGGGFSTATVNVWHADLASRIWLALGWLLWGLVVIALCILADKIADAIQSGGEFRKISAFWLKRMAWIVVIGGHLAKWATDTGQTLIAIQLQTQNFGADVNATIKNPWVIDGVNTNFNRVYGLAVPSAGFSFGLEIWLVLAGIGLYVLARIFDSGKKLEQETEGLV
jgi:hypothetical protein